jgi:hypothetical protein
MKKYVLFPFFLLLTILWQSPICHASDVKESGKASHKFDAELILQEIQKSTEETYSAPDILIMGSLVKKLRDKKTEVIKEFKEKITEVNRAFKEFDEWTFEYFPIENKVSATLAEGK